MPKRKSSILIPVTADGSVPHWCPTKAQAENAVRSFKTQLEAGFTPVTWNTAWTEDRWRAWIKDGIRRNTYDWREPWEFTDTLRLDGFSRGRSAAYFDLISETTGASFGMFMTDITAMINATTIVKGVVRGRWTFCKRGKNYGIKYVGEE